MFTLYIAIGDTHQKLFLIMSTDKEFRLGKHWIHYSCLWFAILALLLRHWKDDQRPGVTC